MASKRSLVEKVERLETRVANLCGQLEVAKRERDKAMGHRDEALKQLKEEIGKRVDLERERDNWRDLRIEETKAAEKERDDLRRQLATIREKHTPFYEALYPGLLYPSISPIGTGISIPIPPQTFNYHAVTRC